MKTSKWTTFGTLFLTAIFTGFTGLAWAANGDNPQAGASNYSNGQAAPNGQTRPSTPLSSPFPGQSFRNPQIGAVNYVEGDVSINGRALPPKAVGSVELLKGQSLVTQSGKAELLLTPGVFLRVDDNSSVTMLSPSLAPTEVEVTKGRAMVEVNYIQKENDVRVSEDGASVKLLKKGLYDFDADEHQVRVFKGKAQVYWGGRKIGLLQRNELALNADLNPKPKGFNVSKAESNDDFYSWSKLRSGYVLEADAELASQYDGYPPAWYWDPWFSAYAFPFDWGYGFYSPFWGYGAPFYGGWGYGPWGYGYGYGHFGPHGFGPHPVGHGFGDHGFGGAHGRGFGGGGFHGGGFGGGGFHGGGGFGGGHGR
jgi:hypothetical protein